MTSPQEESGDPWKRRPTAPGVAPRAERRHLLPVALICLWLAMEIARPPQPLKIPLLCSLALAGFWLASSRKRWHPALTAMMIFLGACWLGIPFSANQYGAFWTSYGLAIILGCICIPAAQFLRTIRHVHLYVGTLLAFSTYVGLFAVTHAGFGPAGPWGGQDENYVAAMMCAAVPFTYFGLAATKFLRTRLLLLAMGLVFLAATVIGFSRGGFLGIAAVLLFCFWYSPRKLVAIVATVIGAATIFAVAPDSYWKEVESIGDTDEGTADHRFELWAIATRQFLDNPVLGVGPGNFRWRIGDYQTEEQQAKFGRSLAGSAIVHSTYFEILSELGSVGVISFAALLFFTFRDLRRAERGCTRVLERVPLPATGTLSRDLEWARAFALAFQGALIGYLVCSAFLSTTYFSTIWLLCAVSVALRFVVIDLVAAASAEPAAHRPSVGSRSAAGEAPVREARPPANRGRTADLLGDHPRRS